MNTPEKALVSERRKRIRRLDKEERRKGQETDKKKKKTSTSLHSFDLQYDTQRSSQVSTLLLPIISPLSILQGLDVVFERSLIPYKPLPVLQYIVPSYSTLLPSSFCDPRSHWFVGTKGLWQVLKRNSKDVRLVCESGPDWSYTQWDDTRVNEKN